MRKVDRWSEQHSLKAAHVFRESVKGVPGVGANMQTQQTDRAGSVQCNLLKGYDKLR